MPILRLKHSLLFIRIKPENDTAKCYFLFFLAINNFTDHIQTFDLKTMPLPMIKKFYEKLADDWTNRYRIN